MELQFEADQGLTSLAFYCLKRDALQSVASSDWLNELGSSRDFRWLGRNLAVASLIFPVPASLFPRHAHFPFAVLPSFLRSFTYEAVTHF